MRLKLINITKNDFIIFIINNKFLFNYKLIYKIIK